MDGLFSLLAIYFPNNPRLKDKFLKNAWHLVLEAYEPDDVKQALVSYLRENKNFPFVQEIAMRCRRKVPVPADLSEQSHKQDLSEARQLRWSVEFHKMLTDAIRTNNLPTSIEAGKKGITYSEWHRQVEAAGISFEVLLEESMRASNEQLSALDT